MSWWKIGIAIVIVVVQVIVVFVFSLCRIAAESDRKMREIFKDRGEG